MNLLALCMTGLLYATSQEFEERRLATVPDEGELARTLFSTDGRNVAYSTVRTTALRHQEWRVVLGEWQSPLFDFAPVFALSGDGKRVLYYGGKRERHPCPLYVNDTMIPEPEKGWQLDTFATMSTDGQTAGYTLRHEERKLWAIALNEKRGKEFSTRVSLPALSADGKAFAYVVLDEAKPFVMVGDMKGPEFEYVGGLALSADGKVVAYTADDGNGEFLLLGDRRIPLGHPAVSIFISPDGAAAGCVLRRGEKVGGKVREFYRVQVGDKSGPEYSSIVQRPVFSADGKTVAYGATDVRGENPGETETFVVIGERKIHAPGLIGAPVFSADGRRVGYGARIGRELWWKVVKVE